MSCVRLYIPLLLFIYILLFIEHNRDVSPENPCYTTTVIRAATKKTLHTSNRVI